MGICTNVGTPGIIRWPLGFQVANLDFQGYQSSTFQKPSIRASFPPCWSGPPCRWHRAGRPAGHAQRRCGTGAHGGRARDRGRLAQGLENGMWHGVSIPIIGSMGRLIVYLPAYIYIVDFHGKWVGKYIPYMDGMGYSKLPTQTSCTIEGSKIPQIYHTSEYFVLFDPRNDSCVKQPLCSRGQCFCVVG